MIRPRAWATFLVIGVISAVANAPGRSVLAADPDPAGVAILQALRNNPVTSPYRFAVSAQGKQYALSGRVGTKLAHDSAIRTLIALGYPIRDDLTIDTGEVNRLASQAPYGSGVGPSPGSSGLGYVYPPPLFGRLDDPFYGLEPPVVSYAPWYGAMAARREPINLNALNGPAPVAPGLNGPAPAPPAAGVAGALPNPIEMTLDNRGVATLRGNVPTLADRVAVGQELARTPGITQVINLLSVSGDARSVSDIPPPPPTPALRPIPAPPRGVPTRAPNTGQPVEGRSIVVDGDPLARRVAESIAHRPALATSPLRVSTRDGVATLSGRLPSPYEAMLAFRAAQQTPGVREVVDRLEFPIPDTDRPNPLRDKGRPEDVEPYLLAQVRHQLGDLAHVDQVVVRGDTLEVRGTVSRADDIPRAEAALRSIPLLRGFRVEPHFQTD